jgi:stress response protein SCP2
MLYTRLDNGKLQTLYDEIVLYGNIQDDQLFGGYRKALSTSMFSDTSYVYAFNVNLHLQAMIDGEIADKNFILKLSNPKLNPYVAKLWSNLPANHNRIRLEIVYLKL